LRSIARAGWNTTSSSSVNPNALRVAARSPGGASKSK
jgi:hypothetical protein